jgi:hypothetical protein
MCPECRLSPREALWVEQGGIPADIAAQFRTAALEFEAANPPRRGGLSPLKSSIIKAIREIGETEPCVRVLSLDANLNLIVGWIETRWSANEVEYEFLAAQSRKNARKNVDFDTEARSTRWLGLRSFCEKVVKAAAL